MAKIYVPTNICTNRLIGTQRTYFHCLLRPSQLGGDQKLGEMGCIFGETLNTDNQYLQENDNQDTNDIFSIVYFQSSQTQCPEVGKTRVNLY